MTPPDVTPLLVKPARARAGALYGLGAAALFGASIPLAKLLLPSAHPVLLGGLLYLGAGVALSVPGPWRRRSEAPVRRGDLPLLAVVVVFGGIAGPILLLTGLQRLSGAAASLLLSLEAPLTILLAVALFGDQLSRRAAVGATLVLGGGLPLALGERSTSGTVTGALLLAGAALSWALENNLTQKLSLRDPVQLVRIKGLAGGACTCAMALLLAGARASAAVTLKAFALGAVSYGLSVVWHIRAVRDLGAARQAALFATAPLFGSALSVLMFGEPFPALAAALMAAGVVLLIRDQHAHVHVHEQLAHEHAHVHDEHHRHVHGGPVSEPHSHWHQHDRLEHEHPHLPDAHHRHAHRDGE